MESAPEVATPYERVKTVNFLVQCGEPLQRKSIKADLAEKSPD